MDKEIQHKTNKNFILIFIGLFFGRILGVIREVILIFFYGATAFSDKLIFLLLIPDLINTLLSSNSITSIVLSNIDKNSFDHKFKFYNKYLFEIGCVFYSLILFFSYIHHHDLLLNSGIVLISIFYNFKFNLEISKSQFFNNFKSTSYSNILFNLGIIISIFLSKIDILFFSLGVTLTSLIRYYLARYYNNLSDDYNNRKSDDLFCKTIIESRFLFLVSIISSSIFFISPLIDKIAFYDLVDGDLSLYNYSEKIYLLPMSLLIGPIITVNFPTLTKLYNSNDKISYFRFAKDLFRKSLVLNFFIFLFFLFFSEYIIKIIFYFSDLTILQLKKIVFFFSILNFGLIPLFCIIWIVNLYVIRKMYYRLFFLSIFSIFSKIIYLLIMQINSISIEEVVYSNLVWLLFCAILFTFDYYKNFNKYK